jgi:hypothetical protein
MPEVHSHSSDAGQRRGLVDFGLAAVCLTLVALLSFLAYQHPLGGGLLPGPRSLVWMCLALVAFFVSGVTLFFYEEDLGGLPLARWATAISGVYLVGCALFDLMLPLHLPLQPWGVLVFGLVTLSCSAWSDSVMLSMIGAELLDQVLATKLAAFFGFVGGFGSTAVFFHMVVAVLELPLGWGLAKRYRRALGMGILCNGALTLTWGLLALGTYGPDLHGHPEWEWVAHVYLALALVASVALARLISRIGDGGSWDLSSRTIIVTISHICRRLGLEQQLSWLIGVFSYWALASTGIFEPDQDGPGLDVTPEMLQDPQQLQLLLARLAEQEPGKVRLGRERQTTMVRAFLLGAVGMFGALAFLGFANQALSSSEAFRLEVVSPTLEAAVRVRIDEVHLPDDLTGGQPMDGYLLPDEVDRYRLKFTDLFVVPRGSPPPEGVDPARAWRVRGRSYACRRSDGRMHRGILLDQRLAFLLPEEWLAEVEPGDTLVFSRGGLGYVYPARLEKKQAPEDPGKSWLF